MDDNYIERYLKFKNGLTPEELKKALEEYKAAFGKDFTIKELIEIKKAEANALIAYGAQDIADTLALFHRDMEWHGINLNVDLGETEIDIPELGTVSESLDAIAEMLEDKTVLIPELTDITESFTNTSNDHREPTIVPTSVVIDQGYPQSDGLPKK